MSRCGVSKTEFYLAQIGGCLPDSSEDRSLSSTEFTKDSSETSIVTFEVDMKLWLYWFESAILQPKAEELHIILFAKRVWLALPRWRDWDFAGRKIISVFQEWSSRSDSWLRNKNEFCLLFSSCHKFELKCTVIDRISRVEGSQIVYW